MTISLVQTLEGPDGKIGKENIIRMLTVTLRKITLFYRSLMVLFLFLDYRMFSLASQYGFVFVAQFFQTRGAMRMKAEEAEDLLSRVKPGQGTVGILL